MSDQDKSLKKDLRHSVIHKTLSLSEGDRLLLSQKIQKRLIDFCQTESGNWGVFKPLPLEPQVDFSFFPQAMTCCYPKVSDHKLKFFKDVTDWTLSPMKVLEPANGHEVAVDELTGLFIPGLAFQINGHRLGRGKGYYDQTLENYLGLKVGISFQFNILNHLPTEKFDVGMDYIITDETIIQPASETVSALMNELKIAGDLKTWN